jgi:hypothetical protein
VGYGQIKTPNWNAFLDVYNAGDTVTSKHPYLKHVPCASVIYERKLAEYLYVQGLFNFSYTNSASKQHGDLKWDIMGFGANLAVNFYPFKLIKGLAKTPFNPLLLQFACGGNYLQKSFKLNGENVMPPEIKGFSGKNIAIVATGGIGYDLHFGKRVVVQTIFDLKYMTETDMPELSYFVHEYEKLGLSTQSTSVILGGKISLLFLFKGLGARRKNNINSKRSMFS